MKLMNNAITRNFGLDMLRVGFHGTHIAAGDTDPATYPLGQDVNKGWLAIVKKSTSASISVCNARPNRRDTRLLQNLDALANDLENTTIHEVFQDDPDLVVLVGRDLVAAEQHRLLEAADKPTEHKAAQSLAKTINGKKAYTPPFFPPKAMWITTLKNLQILTQKVRNGASHVTKKTVSVLKRLTCVRKVTRLVALRSSQRSKMSPLHNG